MTEDPIRDGYNWYAYTAHFGDPVNYFDVDGLTTTIIITRDPVPGTFGLITFGTHAAVHIDNPNGMPTLYDPAGSYWPTDEYGGPLRGSNDTLYEDAADIDKYKEYHEKDGTIVETHTVQTTPEEESEIADRIEQSGGKPPFACGVSVSDVIRGVGPFPEDKDLIPGTLEDTVKKIVEEQQKIPESIRRMEKEANKGCTHQ